jgi:DNA-directed RNA polymerase beta subunit
MAEPEKKVEVQPPGSQKAPPGGAVNTPAPVAVDTLLRPSDTKGLRKRIYDHTFEAIQNLQPVSNSKYSLHVENPRWIDPETWSPSHQKKTFYQGGTLARRIQGDYVLKDLLTDKEVSRKSATVASVPHLNDRGLFLLNGSHWHLGSQTRLDPGIYPKIQDNGEFKAMVNPSGGRQHSLTLDPESGVFHFEIGSSRIPLMSVLRSLGVDNKRFHDEWGRDLVEKNAAKADPSAVRKLVEKLYDGDKIPEGLRDDELLTKKFGAMKLDPYVMKQTIGHAHESYDSESMLRTAKRLLALSRGEVPHSERDHQAFQHVLGQEHLFAERAKNSRPLLNQALWKATYKGNLDNLPSGLLNQHLAETITATGLGVNAQMTNPAEMLDAAYRVSKMGKGGVASLDAVPDSMRDVHSSQFYFVDPIVTPESGKAGVDSRFSAATARDKQGRIYTQMYNRDGSPRWMTARDTKGMTIAPWESRNSKADWVEAIRDGEMAMVPRSKVDVFSPPTEMAFSPVANMVPFKSASPAHRTAMGARMITQALPLINAESPHVQSGSPMGGSFEQHYGKHFGAIKAEQAGRVMSVGPESIKVKYMNGETADINLHKHDLYDHAPGRKTHFTHTPMVKPGDFFKPDQLLAKSNYTDNEGRAALGLNLRTAWLPARNAGNFEDAFAFSESAAKRMMSDHMALHSAEEPGMKFGKTNFRSLFPAAYTPEHLKNLDDNGVVKPGAIVKPGQPLVLATRESKMPRTTLVRSPKPIQQDVSEVWDHDYPGEVVDVVKTKSGYRVSVKSAVPMADADKVSGRHGNKGIVTIVPDHQMPIGEDGKPFEVLVSPYSLPSRKNTSQIAELLLGKIAHKHGKKYELPDFQEDDLRQYVANELQKHGMKATESITDPVTGTKIPGVLTGHQFLMKLHHLVETKLKQRDTGSYDSFGTPAKGGSDGAKRMSQADTFALLAHRAEAFLRGTQGVRGQRNEHFWEAVLSGHTPPTPGVSNQYRRMVEGLRASGIHPVQENGKLRLTALTDKDVDNFAGDREIKNPGGLDWGKDGEPVPGGLFDKGLHGEDGSRWSKLSLHTPMPNPAFEDAIRYTLGLTEKQMRGVLAGTSGLVGRKHFDPATATEPTPHGYVAGPQAIHEALRSIDLPKEMAQAVAAIQGNKKTKRDEAIRKYKFLKGAEDQKLHPADWMLKAMPVLPPNLRPVSKLEGSNTELVSDPNYLYQDLFHANKNLRDLSARTRDVAEERLALYDAMKAVTGLGDPINPKHQQKGVKGIMKMILGESPKWSLPQHKLMSTPVDLVGRSTVGPDSSLDMDEVGIPEKMAFTVYKRFVEKRLVRNGMAPVEAVRAVREQAPEAKRALMQEMEVRPVSYHRAPVLHKYGHIGGWPKLVKGDVIKVSPFVIKGLGMDFDGDTANIHVPVYDKEIEDVRDRMMPSRNLLSAKDFQVHYKPEREFHVGLWQATQGQGKEGERERVFDDINAVRRAFARGEITVKDKVTVMKH